MVIPRCPNSPFGHLVFHATPLVTDPEVAPVILRAMMKDFFEQLFASTWNRFRGRDRGARHEGKGVEIGRRVIDGDLVRERVTLSNAERTRHIAILGKTGSGKSSLLRSILAQDIEADRGFACFDLHGEFLPFLLRTINARERRLHRHLSDKLIIVDPTDPIISVGLNPLEQESPDFTRIAEFSEVLRKRWTLDHFGARTDELLRNSLFVLSVNSLTIVELTPFLVHSSFRAACLKRVTNTEVKQYFEFRYEVQSEAMRAVMREPILNKISAFTSNDAFRHVVGQAQSSFSVREAMDSGCWVIVNLDKGKLGPQALTLGSLFFAAFKNALFSRERRTLFSLVVDEAHNLLAADTGIDTVLAESRKWGIGLVLSQQLMAQQSAETREMLSGVGTQIFFQLSSPDAQTVSTALDGGKPLAERLKNLPQRHCVVKSGADRWMEACVSTVRDPTVDYTDLLNRSRYARGRVRSHIERDIAKRQELLRQKPDEVLHEWE